MARRANSEGSVYQRKKDGRWVAALSLPDGTRRAFYAKTRAEALERRDAARRQLDEGLPLGDDRLTVATFFPQWLEAAAPEYRESTVLRYEAIVARHIVPALGRRRLGSLTPMDLERLYAGKLRAGLAPRTVGNIHRVIRRALGYAAQRGMVRRNVAAVVSPPSPGHTEMRVLTAGQAQRLLEAARGDRLEALYVLALYTGMRQGELLGLRWNDIALDAGAIQVTRSLQISRDGYRLGDPKTESSRRHLPLVPAAVDALRAHRVRQHTERLGRGAAWEDHGLVFANALGRPVTPSSLRGRSFRPLLDAAGLPPVRFHDLRHTAATLLLLQGVHAKVVSEMLGHATITITLDTYSHVLPSMKQEAADALARLLGS